MVGVVCVPVPNPTPLIRDLALPNPGRGQIGSVPESVNNDKLAC